MTFYIETSSRQPEVHSSSLLESVIRALSSWIEIQLLKAAVHRERRQLADLSAQQLRDIGITRAQARVESERKDLPAQRMSR